MELKDYVYLYATPSKEQYKQLELSLVATGCKEPIVVWDGIIIDGYNRYEICNRLNIPYDIKEVHLDSEATAIVRICKNQLSKNNLSVEMHKYLLGKLFHAQKISSHQNGTKTALRLGKKYDISYGTVLKYALYSDAIDRMCSVAPYLATQILTGKYRISHEKLIGLSTQNDKFLFEYDNKLISKPTTYINHNRLHRDKTEKRISKTSKTPAIKIMPKFDPNAEVIQLTLTIPSWISSIERINSDNLELVADTDRAELCSVLARLQDMVTDLRRVLGA